MAEKGWDGGTVVIRERGRGKDDKEGKKQGEEWEKVETERREKERKRTEEKRRKEGANELERRGNGREETRM